MTFWYIFYAIFITSSIRFFLHNSILALPIKFKPFAKKTNTNKILIQYPICNEPMELIKRFFDSLLTIPVKERYRIVLQVCDDSKVSIHKELLKLHCPVKMLYSRRWDDLRNKFKKKNKASNMNYGLSKATAFPYVAIFDADHIMDGVGLIEAAEILSANDNISCVQSRWIPIKCLNTALSVLQEQIIHLHIEREQLFKSVNNLWPIFNGAGALWRIKDVQEAVGGWIEVNVCEDTDLSGLMNARGYNIRILPTWVTLIDHVYDWDSYRKQQRRWAQGNGIQLVRHLLDPHGWGWKKLYWLSWNCGHLVALTKYVIPVVMLFKLITGNIIWLDQLLLAPHLLTWMASTMTWDNKWYWRGALTYPLMFIIEFAILPYQILGWIEGVFSWNKHIDFVVTYK